MNEIINRFMINDKVCIVTGGAGLLGYKHAEAIKAGGGIPVLIDISEDALIKAKNNLSKEEDGRLEVYKADITDKNQLKDIRDDLIEKYGKIDVLINNAANNPKMEKISENMGNIKFDNFPLNMWNEDLSVGLTGAFLCAQIFGSQMERQGFGVILNVSSDLGVIAPDQRIYRKDGIRESEQIVKPVTYSVIKHGLLGLTKYLATYWAEKNIRVNAICPAGVENGQPEEFKRKLVNLVPMGRMAQKDEYQCTILYLISDASSYMTGSTLIVDGGRTCW